MKKIIVNFLILAFIFLLVSCKRSNELFEKDNSTFGFEAMSSISLLNTFDTNQTTSAIIKLDTNKQYINLENANNELTDEQIEQINNYLTIMEQMVNDNAIEVTVDESDRANFNNKMVVTTRDINQNIFRYTLYYNETFLNEGNEDDEDDDDQETESTIEGILVVEEKEYSVTGKRETEDDEMKVEFKAIIDENNWVRVEQETEESESQFKYTVSNNGVLSSTKMKFEQEDNETKLMITFINGNVTNKYQFKEETEDGQKIIHIKTLDENVSLNIKVYAISDPITKDVTYEYRFVETGKSVSKGRHDFKNDDDEKD